MLYQNYIKPKDYDAVSEVTTTKMNVKWDPTTPFGTFLCQQQLYKNVLEQCRNTIDCSIMIRQSDLELACDKWESKAEADQTWKNFKKHFTIEVANA